MAADTVLLYNVPPSFYSQIARLVLYEKGVPWRTKLIAPGPPTFESYEPWYMKLNPGGTVPTMVHNGDVVPDSYLIAEYAESHFGGPSLVPAHPHERAEMERWIEAWRGLSIRELSYGSDKAGRVGAFVNGLRVKRLEKLLQSHPEMAEIYQAKIADITEFSDHAADRTHMDGLRRSVSGLLDELESTLSERRWIAGETYSLADTVWTVTIARLMMLDGDAPLEGRPALKRWFMRVRQRPSYDGADVWDRFKAGRMLAVLARKLWPQLTLLLLVCAALAWGLWRLFG